MTRSRCLSRACSKGTRPPATTSCSPIHFLTNFGSLRPAFCIGHRGWKRCKVEIFRRRARQMIGCLIAINLAALLFLHADSAAQTAEPGPIRAGDRWSYEIKDDLTGDLRHAVTVVVVDITDKEITTRTAIRGKDRPQTMVFDLDWGRIDDGAWRLQPSGIGIKRPLQVGKE